MDGKKPRGSMGRLLLLIPLLLLVAVAVNWSDISAIVKGEKSLKGVLMGRQANVSAALEGWVMPKDVGAEDARVRVDIFLHQGDPCHVDFLYIGQSLGTVEPERIRVQFLDTAGEAGRKRFSELNVGCEQGMAINGKAKFKLPPRKEQPGATSDPGNATTPSNVRGAAPVPEDPTKERTLYLTLDGGWDTADLHYMLDSELKTAYKGKGMRISVEELKTHMTAKTAEFRARLEDEMKARKEAEEAEG